MVAQHIAVSTEFLKSVACKAGSSATSASAPPQSQPELVDRAHQFEETVSTWTQKQLKRWLKGMVNGTGVALMDKAVYKKIVAFFGSPIVFSEFAKWFLYKRAESGSATIPTLRDTRGELLSWASEGSVMLENLDIVMLMRAILHGKLP
jgi:hypothetical protein